VMKKSGLVSEIEDSIQDKELWIGRMSWKNPTKL
jgi:hypothetical protein